MSVGVVIEEAGHVAAQLALGAAIARARDEPLRAFFAEGLFAGEEECANQLKRNVESGQESSCHVFDVQRPGALLQGFAEQAVETAILVRVDTKRSDALRKRVLSRAACEVLVWLPRAEDGQLPENCRVLVPMARGSHARAALRMAFDLAGDGGRVSALYVEPDVGLDAMEVGRAVLDRLVDAALGADRADRVERHVVIGNQVWRGILTHVEESEQDLVLLGASKLTELGQKVHGTVGLRVSNAAEGAAVGIVRGPAQWTGRIRSLVEQWVLRSVPQLERDARIQFVERVQSNSFWNFDFIALMSCATLIAAVGLVQNAEPVVIGAMLVAPLMTPILGLGLALVHGNPVLARAALRNVAYGSGTAFVIGLGLGLVQPGFEVPTDAMIARDWPGLLDLVVAFVAGLAGAYASCRPNLLAALPGVAIAAALVPPIAVSGLAVALGDWPLAAGASMLFFTNMVGIIVAAAICLWLVGMRDVKPRSPANRLAGFALIGLVLALGFWFSPSEVPHGFRDAVRARVPRAHRLDGPIRTLKGARGQTVVVIRLAGLESPGAALADDLRTLAVDRFGEADVEVRLDWQWEDVAAAGAPATERAR